MMSASAQHPLVIWGASGHARVVADIVRLQGVYRIVGFLDDVNPDRHGAEFCGEKILGGQEQIEMLHRNGIRNILLGFGDCRMRLKMTRFLQEQGFSLPIAIHPSAVVAQDVVIGPGTVIAAGAVVNPGVKIGSSVIINTAASVDHDCIIGDAAHICPGVHLAGRVTVGQAAWVGIGAVVSDGLCIGARATIGAGAVVINDIPNDVIAFGVPARIKEMLER